MPHYIDSHSHLADPRFAGDIESILQRAKEVGITHHLQGGIGPEDWERQFILHIKHPEILPVVGLHPYWISEHNEDECEVGLSRLSKVIGQAYALGETGLDFRPQYLKESLEFEKEKQIDFFRNQLEIANFVGKPVVLHIVRAFDEAIRVLEHTAIKNGGMIHSFNGSLPEAKAYLDLGFHLSIGGPVTRFDNKKLHQAVKEIPLDKLLVETDSPDQPPESIKGQRNTPSTLLDVAEKIAEIKNLKREEILDRSSQNLRKLIHYESNH